MKQIRDLLIVMIVLLPVLLAGTVALGQPNTAVISVPKLEEDSYDWWARHKEILDIGIAVNPEIVLIGDSITHFWSGQPKAAIANGPKAWDSVFENYSVLNLGFGWDRTQNVLWRLEHGELDGLHPRIVIINIGTNNTSQTTNARQNTSAEIAEGVLAVCNMVRSKLPNAKIILMGVFPREEKPDHPRRFQIAEINRLISEFGKMPDITFLDIGSSLIESDGTISKDIMFDFCHPTQKGYQIWADALNPLIKPISVTDTEKEKMKVGEISNSAYRLTVSVDDQTPKITLYDLAMGFSWSDAPYVYSLSIPMDDGFRIFRKLESVSLEKEDHAVTVTGILAGLEIKHRFELPADKPVMEEKITLCNLSSKTIGIKDIEFGFQCRVTSVIGNVLPEFTADRVVAIPFRVRATDPAGSLVSYLNDFSISELTRQSGGEFRVAPNQNCGNMPSRHRYSEGWAWTHGKYTLGIFKYNQQNLEYSVISPLVQDDGLSLRLGGTCMISGEPAVLTDIASKAKIELGVTRYQTLAGDYTSAMYAFRDMLDEKGCRFPVDYNPPVQWNELFDNPEWSVITPGLPKEARQAMRARTFSRELIEREAVKAKAYHCQAIYLDPGWDTAFGSLLWGSDWLGTSEKFIADMKKNYGLGVSLHFPMATWISHPVLQMDSAGAKTWPKESYRMDAKGQVVEGEICLSSSQYIQEAFERLSVLCDDGVGFYMFDGNWWPGPCWNPNHGHSVPLTKEEHFCANIKLAQLVHSKYPDVLIEMHDMLTGGSPARIVPVYYKYGLPQSYDENWGFELMWYPMNDLRSGRDYMLYYYNLSCNIPLYLHFDLRDDNEHCLLFWWFASTARHLGFGGTHSNPAIVDAQKDAMRNYIELERFFKRGEFFGISEEIHIHVLPQENAFVVNVFNLSDKERVVEGEIPISRLGLDPNLWYSRSERWGDFDAKKGVFRVSCPLPAWGTKLMKFGAI